MSDRTDEGKGQALIAAPKRAVVAVLEGKLGERKQVEHAADRIREELLRTLKELDRRREQALNLHYQWTEHRSTWVWAGGVTLGAVAVGVGWVMWRSHRRHTHLAQKRWTGLKRAWLHPERIASSAKEPPLGAELGRRLVMIFASALAGALAKRSVEVLVPTGKSARRDAGSPALA